MLLIPMDMPKNCDECLFLYESRGYMECKLTEQVTDFRQATTERLQDCPLVEVPPHGRLIDADALQTESFNRLFIGFARNRDVAFVNFLLTDAPTVIPAEESKT